MLFFIVMAGILYFAFVILPKLGQDTKVEKGKRVGNFKRLNDVEGILTVDDKKIKTYNIGSLLLAEKVGFTFFESGREVTITDIELYEESLYSKAPQGLNYRDKADYAIQSLKKKSNFGQIDQSLVLEAESIVLEVDILNKYIRNGNIVHSDEEGFSWLSYGDQSSVLMPRDPSSEFKQINAVEGLLKVGGKEIKTYTNGILTLRNQIDIFFFDGHEEIIVQDIAYKGQLLYPDAQIGSSIEEKAKYAIHLLKHWERKGQISHSLISEVEEILLEVSMLNSYLQSGNILREADGSFYWRNYGNNEVTGNKERNSSNLRFEPTNNQALNRKKISAASLRVNDKIKLSSGEEQKITDIKKSSTPGRLILFFGTRRVVVESTDNYFLQNGIYIHENKVKNNLKKDDESAIKDTSYTNSTSQTKGNSKTGYDYAKQRYYVDSLVTPFLPDLYKQCRPILKEMLDRVQWTSREEYRKFSTSVFADRIYEQHFFMAFVNGWKRGYFSLGQVVNYEKTLDEEIEEIYETVLEDALETYEMKTASQFLHLTEMVNELGYESGTKTNIDAGVSMG